jgi:hypothetical protein
MWHLSPLWASARWSLLYLSYLTICHSLKRSYLPTILNPLYHHRTTLIPLLVHSTFPVEIDTRNTLGEGYIDNYTFAVYMFATFGVNKGLMLRCWDYFLKWAIFGLVCLCAYLVGRASAHDRLGESVRGLIILSCTTTIKLNRGIWQRASEAGGHLNCLG